MRVKDRERHKETKTDRLRWSLKVNRPGGYFYEVQNNCDEGQTVTVSKGVKCDWTDFNKG